MWRKKREDRGSDVSILVEDEELNRLVRWQLLDYGYDPDSRDLKRRGFSDLTHLREECQEKFRKEELRWWRSSLTKYEQRATIEAWEKNPLAGPSTPPIVSRPLEYAALSGYGIPIETKRKFIDRGLAVARDAISKHFILLNGAKLESTTKLAFDPVAAPRFLALAEKLRLNRPAAEELMLAQDGSLPPSRGQEFDVPAFHLAARRITNLYQQREADPAILEAVMAECRKMIAHSPEFLKQFHALKGALPRHKGFEQLAVIFDRLGAWDEAATLCDQARREGWEGDWNKRIERYQKKLNRPKSRKAASKTNGGPSTSNFCTACGTRRIDGDRFCPQCGKSFAWANVG